MASNPAEPPRIFELPVHKVHTRVLRFLVRLVKRPIESVSGLRAADGIYARAWKMPKEIPFCDRVLQAVGVRTDFAEDELLKVKKEISSAVREPRAGKASWTRCSDSVSPSSGEDGRGVSGARAEATAWLERVGLGHRLRHYPKHLSGGEQQRVALARAFAPAPQLVLADEPTGNLDAATGHQIIELMFAINAERGTTLILVTHDEEIAARCGRRLRMHAGEIAEVVGD